MKKYMALFLVFCMVTIMAPTQVVALDQATISAGCETASPGKNVTVCVDASNFKNIAGLTLSVFYNANALRVVNVSTGAILSGAISSVNSGIPGEITLSVVSQEAIGENGTLLIIELQVLGNCEAGIYPVEIVVNEAYTTSLQIASIQTVNGSVSVEKGADTPATFEIRSNTDRNNVHNGDSIHFSVSNGNSAPFASCDFIVEYDPDALQYDSVQLSDGLTVDGAIYSIHAQTPGVVRISYTSDTSVRCDDLFSVKFTVCTEQDTDTCIVARAQNIYRDDLSAYYPASSNVCITLFAQPAVVDDPDVYLESELFIIGEECTSDFVLEAGAGVAAADFVIRYDPSVLHCISVKASDKVSGFGGMIVINDNYYNGEIRFSYVNTKGYADSDIPLITITWMPLHSPASHYEIRSSGTGIVDLAYNTLTLEHKAASGCIYQKNIILPSCEKPGFTEYACSCGEAFATDQVPAIGHLFPEYTVDEYGVKTSTCSRQGCGEKRTLTPESLEITTMPDKLIYRLTEELDLTGLSVTVFYDDGSSEPITSYTVSDYRPVPGDQTIVISYGRCVTSFIIHVLSSGDCNEDGTIDWLDLECLRNYLAARDPVTIISAVAIGSGADYNGDGVINGVDLAMLRAYLAAVD